METLEIGTIVHYVHPNGTHSPARVTHIWNSGEGVVDLFVMRDDEIHDHYNTATVVHSAEPKPYTWHFVEGEAASKQESLL